MTLAFWSRLVAWSAVPIYLVGIAVTFWVESRISRPDEESALELAALIVGFGADTVVGALLVAKRPENPVGWILVTVGLMIGLFVPADAYTAYTIATEGPVTSLVVAGAWFQSWYWYILLALLFIFLPMLFPDGRLPSRRFRPLAIAVAVFTAITAVVASLAETLTGEGYSIPNPIGIEGLAYIEDIPAWEALSVFYLVGIIGALIALVVRFRGSGNIERQQLKWFLFPIAVFLLGAVIEIVSPVVSSITFAVALVGLPVAIAVAVLRFRLYEIDRIISRTVTYGLLVLMLGAIYSVVVFLVQSLLPPASGDLAVAGSTLAAAAAFSPLRRRLQTAVDRRFNRSRYLAEKVFGDFNTRLRASFDVGEVTSDLHLVVSKTLAPATTGLWLRSR